MSQGGDDRRRAFSDPRAKFVESPAFSLTSEPIDEQRHLVAVAGELDVSTAPQLKSALIDAIESGRTRIVVDLAETSFVDSSGLAALVAAVKRLRPLDGVVAIVNTNPYVAKAFEMTRFDALFTFHRTREGAVASL